VRSIHRASVLLVLAAACGNPAPADPDAAPDPAPTAPVADTDVFTETAVWFNADGTTRVETRPITVAEERAIAARMIAAPGKVHPLIAADPSCAGSFQLWDQWYFVGDRICFHGAGTADLSQYWRPVCFDGVCRRYDWQISRGSWWDDSTESGYWLADMPPNRPDGGTAETAPFWPQYLGNFDVPPKVLRLLVLTN
jgi:hypothetical protein